MRSSYIFASFLIQAAQLAAVELGDTRRSVVTELGHPRGTMVVGEKEVLDYGTGKVVLVEGVVDRVYGTLSPGTEQPIPRAEGTRPPPRPSAESSASAASNQRTTWITDFNLAKVRATQQNKRILVLFTGSDWCPPCQQFEREVAHDAQFAGIFAPSFVFMKVDWLRNTPTPPEEAAAVAELIKDYDVSRFPSLKVLNAGGEELADVDWTRPRSGSFKEIMIEAIDEARKATEGGKKSKRGWWPW